MLRRQMNAMPASIPFSRHSRYVRSEQTLNLATFLSLHPVVLGVPVEDESAGLDEGVVLVGPDLGQVEGVERTGPGLVVGHYLKQI